MEHTLGLIIRMRAFPPDSISFAQMLLITTKQEVSLQEARRYILTKYPQTDLDWTLLSDSELAAATDQCLSFVVKERPNWEKLAQHHQKRLQKYSMLFQKISGQFGLDSYLSKEATLKQLKQRHQYLWTGVNGGQKRPQYEELGTLVQLLQNIIHFQAQQQNYVKQNDKELKRKAAAILTQLQTSIEAQLNEQRQTIINHFRQAEDAYKAMLLDCKQNLQQIYLYNCMQSNPCGSNFDNYQKMSQMLDLRFYLKYFEDIKSQQNNMKKYSQANLIELFKKYSCNGRWISFNQFWTIHKRLFGIDEIAKKTKKDSFSAAELPALTQKYENMVEKLQPLSAMIAASCINERVKRMALSPSKLIKARSVSLPQLANRQPSQLKEGVKRKLSFVQQVRHEVSQQALPRSNSINAIPLILRIPSDKIESEGIYQSLKRFANYDYLAQEKKIKSIIGLSGTSERFMDEFLSRESVKVEKKVRGKGKEGNGSEVVHERCRRYRGEGEPFLRF